MRIFLVGMAFASGVNMATDTARELLSEITDDVKTLAKGEVELVRREIGRVAKEAAVDTAVVTFGGIVTLIGFGMLCVAAVVALGAVIDSLAVRLVLMAAVYLLLGGGLATAFGLKLKRDLVPDLDVAKHEASAVVEGVKATIGEQGSSAHA